MSTTSIRRARMRAFDFIEKQICELLHNSTKIIKAETIVNSQTLRGLLYSNADLNVAENSYKKVPGKQKFKLTQN